ncbi:PAS domain-containing sensor histidine kinase, partial [Rhizobiaceae sp. 2RAB30]
MNEAVAAEAADEDKARAEAPEVSVSNELPAVPPVDEAPSVEAVEEESPQAPNVPASQAKAEETKAEDDRWYFNAGEERTARPSLPPHVREPADTPAGDEHASPKDDAVQPEPPVERSKTPVRFVWRTDAQGRFSAISDEFAGAVGPAAADVIGRRFGDVATMLGFDPDREITGLLERRDTWSGRSVLWPVAGTDLRIPVDLAALPAYGRSRDFEGFRGFGVARPGDAIVDPEGIGLTLTPDYRPPAMPSERQAAVTDAKPSRPSEADERAGRDPFAGEVPALAIVPKPERRQSDKVIRLAEHRAAPVNDKGGLTAVERNAFREIGDRLKK